MFNNRLRIVLVVLISCMAIGLLILSIQPYGTFKGFFDSLMPDRDFESLKEGNALIFRGFIILVGMGLLVLALLMAGKWRLDVNRLRGEIFSLGRSLLPDKDEKLFFIVLAGITLWGGAMRLVYLYAPMSHDESYAVAVFSPSLWYAITNYHAPNNQIFHTILIHFSTAIFGFQPWAVRLPAYLAGILIIPATYLLGKAIYDRYAGLLAAILVAWWPVQIRYSTSARGYTLVALLTLIVLWLATIVRKDNNLIGWLLIVFFSALGFYTIPVMLFPFGILFVWLFMENMAAGPGQGYRSRIDFSKYWLSSGLAIFLLTLIFYSPIFIYGGTHQFLMNGMPNAFNQVGLLVLENIGGMYTDWTANIPTLLVLVLGIGILLSLVFHRRLSAHRFPLQVAFAIWIGLVLIIQRPNAWSRIWFSLAALFVIWASAGIVGLIKDIRLRNFWNLSASTALITCVLIGVFAVGVKSLATLPQAWASKGREEQAVLFLKDRLGGQDIIIAPSPQDAPLWYYSRLYGISDQYFARNQPFTRAYVLALPVQGQPLHSVIDEFGLTDVVDMQTVRLLQGYSGLNIYEVMHK
jgi:4-amino-4-deoxy-L-arabinose transferase-like glycosyltransferase